MKPSVLLSWLAVFLVLAACETNDGGGPTDASGGTDAALPADTAAPTDTPDDGSPPDPCATCPAACASDDDCDPGRRCLADECGCVTCVDRAVPYSGLHPCREGYETVQAPPVSPDEFLGGNACVPARCDDSGCYNDTDCADGTRCAGEDVWGALQGRCLPAVEPPACFDAEDCPAGSTCTGALACPPCRPCETAMAPGHCVADAGAGPVFFHVREAEWGYFGPGPIAARWLNLGAETAYLPGCDALTVEGVSVQQWSWSAAAASPSCTGEEPVVPLPPAAALPVDDLEILCPCNPDGSVRVHIEGRYGFGCAEGLPFEDAGCTSGPIGVMSDDFWVAVPY